MAQHRRQGFIQTMVAVALIGLTSGSVSAQDEGAFARQGVLEVGGSMYLETTADFEYGFFRLSPLVGYFLADGFEAGMTPTIFIGSYRDDPGIPFVFDLSATYHFPSSSSVNPYVGALLGIYRRANVYYGDSGGGHYGLQGGLKVTVVDHAMVHLGVQYYNESLGRDGSYVIEDPLVMTAGFSVWFD